MNVNDDFLKKTLLAAAESYPRAIPHEECEALMKPVDEKVIMATWVYMYEKGLITKSVTLGSGDHCNFMSPTLTAYGIDYVREIQKQAD